MPDGTGVTVEVGVIGNVGEIATLGMVVSVGSSVLVVAAWVKFDPGDEVGMIETCEVQEASRTATRRKNAHLILVKINSFVKFKLISAHPISLDYITFDNNY